MPTGSCAAPSMPLAEMYMGVGVCGCGRCVTVFPLSAGAERPILWAQDTGQEDQLVTKKCNIRNIYPALLMLCLIPACSGPRPSRLSETDLRPAEPAPPSSDVVVEVNGHKLMQSELDIRVTQAIAAQRMGQLPPEMLARFRDDLEPKMIEGFISKILLESDARQQDAKILEKDIDDALSTIKANFPDEAAFAAALQQNETTEPLLRADIEAEMRIKQVIDKCVVNLPKITDRDIKEFYDKEKANFARGETVHARHVLVACADTASKETKAEKKALAEKIRKKIVDGSDFASVAREQSDCPSGKSDGGDLGTFGRGRMAKEFENAAFTQKVDKIGPIVMTEFGYHIIEVLAHNAPSTVPLEEVTERIAEYLTSQRDQEAILKHIETLKKTARIKYRNPAPPVQ